MTLTEYLKQNKTSGPARFYMPGHKGRCPLDAAYDITEIAGADSLYAADGVIRGTEKRFETLYGSGATVLSAGGTTLCVQGMLAAAQKKYGFKKIVAARNAHIAFVNACALLGLEPVWVVPKPYDRFGVSGAVTLESLEKTVRANPDAGAVYITSPDYFGMLSDIRGLSEVCRKHGLSLLVDNAHGAHLKFLPEDVHPLSQGADLCCDGAHKTLPVLTGGALLHAADGFSVEELKAAMTLFGSTSPSYLVLQSLDACTDYLETAARDDFRTLTERLMGFRALAREKGFFVFDSEPARLSLAGAAKGFDGDLGAYFRAHGVECDYAAAEAAVLLPSPCNTEEEFARLKEAIKAFEPDESYKPEPVLSMSLPVRAMGLREAALAPAETVDIADAAGRIAAESRITCPPGVAVVVAGERIAPEHQKILKKSGISQMKVV